jgi:hypothetical protein
MMRFRLCSELGPAGYQDIWAEIIQLSPQSSSASRFTVAAANRRSR